MGLFFFFVGFRGVFFSGDFLFSSALKLISPFPGREIFKKINFSLGVGGKYGTGPITRMSYIKGMMSVLEIFFFFPSALKLTCPFLGHEFFKNVDFFFFLFFFFDTSPLTWMSYFKGVMSILEIVFFFSFVVVRGDFSLSFLKIFFLVCEAHRSLPRA